MMGFARWQRPEHQKTIVLNSRPRILFCLMPCRPFRLLRLEIFFSVLVYPFPACHQNEEKKSVLVSFSEHFRSGSVLVSTFFFWFLLWFPSGILYSKTKRLMTTSNKTYFSFFFVVRGFRSGSGLLLAWVSILVPA